MVSMPRQCPPTFPLKRKKRPKAIRLRIKDIEWARKKWNP
jgi:hypothetical protein